MRHPKAATPEHAVLDVITERWSPRAFDRARPVGREAQLRLFEAARWAPSSANDQPWRFHVADRFTAPAAFAALLATLTGSNQTWAQYAPLLILVTARPVMATGHANPHAWYDTGQAVSLLSIQATSMGLGVRQVAGFDREQARAAAGLDAADEPVVVVAVGFAGDANQLPVEHHRQAETAPRHRHPLAGLVRWLAVVAAVLAGSATSRVGALGAPAAPVYGYAVVKSYPHDRTAFTQGLVFLDGVFYESTGIAGQSDVRKVDPLTGRILQRTPVDAKYFAEGLAEWRGTLVQLTWQHGIGFVYDRETLSFRRTFRYSGEGWGLTQDGTRLIQSDGNAASGLRFFDPETFEETGRVVVTDGGVRVDHLNELEYIDGEVWANVWTRDRIARIDPKTGVVRSWVDLSGLLPARDRAGVDVLNGIAWDPKGRRLFVTGKLWPKLFEIRVTRAPVRPRP